MHTCSERPPVRPPRRELRKHIGRGAHGAPDLFRLERVKPLLGRVVALGTLDEAVVPLGRREARGATAVALPVRSSASEAIRAKLRGRAGGRAGGGGAAGRRGGARTRTSCR